MILFQNGYECRDKIKLFYGLFFDDSEDVTVSSSFEYDGSTVNVYTVIAHGGAVYDDDYYYSIDKGESAAMKRKAFDAAVTKSFCNAAFKIRKINLPWGVMSGIRPAKNVRELTESGVREENIVSTLRSLYAVSEDKAKLALTVAKNERDILSRSKPDYVSLYIGIPFCPTRCLYCSFVSTDMRVSGKYMDEYVRLLLKEIDKTGEILRKKNARVQTVYIGGGTPTTLSAEQIAAVCERLRPLIAGDTVEFTLEAGRPDTITPEKLLAAKKGGVTRISINPQTMNEKTLVRVGRTHTPDQVEAAVSAARKACFDNINMDLIAGLPGESFEDFKYSIDAVAKLDPESITVHSMCVKRSAALRFSGEVLAEADVMNKMLSYAQKKMSNTERIPYYMYRQKNISGNLENVGYAKAGYMSFYNINIMEEIQTIIALGCGGSTKLVMGDRIERIFNFKDPATYIERFDEILKKKDEILEIERKCRV